MSNSICIKADNISKAYQLGEFNTGTLSNDISRKWALMRGKEDPFLKIGETNDRTTQGQSDIVWSLKDINFEIKQGDAVGIIGRNGAGKSTLLKILSRVTSPTIGSIRIKGRIASLLEVGTGFHPELTGRENVFLNGAILGMRKAEIKKHFDAIVDFSGVERYIDTPVKRYSSGMYVRLAFAVAAYLESEILIVDEVLAVGDAEFQKKCLGKMGDISKGEGRTILFVSHNMSSIRELCTYGMLLERGSIAAFDTAANVIEKYMQQSRVSRSVWTRTDEVNDEAYFTKVWLSNSKMSEISVVDNNEINYLNIEVNILKTETTGTIAFEIKSALDISIFCSHDYDLKSPEYKLGKSIFQIRLPEFLKPGFYFLNLGINGRGFFAIDFAESVISFEIVGSASNAKPLQDARPGLLYLPLAWNYI